MAGKKLPMSRACWPQREASCGFAFAEPHTDICPRKGLFSCVEIVLESGKELWKCRLCKETRRSRQAFHNHLYRGHLRWEMPPPGAEKEVFVNLKRKMNCRVEGKKPQNCESNKEQVPEAPPAKITALDRQIAEREIANLLIAKARSDLPRRGILQRFMRIRRRMVSSIESRSEERINAEATNLRGEEDPEPVQSDPEGEDHEQAEGSNAGQSNESQGTQGRKRKHSPAKEVVIKEPSAAKSGSKATAGKKKTVPAKNTKKAAPKKKPAPSTTPSRRRTRSQSSTSTSGMQQDMSSREETGSEDEEQLVTRGQKRKKALLIDLEREEQQEEEAHRTSSRGEKELLDQQRQEVTAIAGGSAVGTSRQSGSRDVQDKEMINALKGIDDNDAEEQREEGIAGKVQDKEMINALKGIDDNDAEEQREEGIAGEVGEQGQDAGQGNAEENITVEPIEQTQEAETSRITQMAIAQERLKDMNESLGDQQRQTDELRNKIDRHQQEIGTLQSTYKVLEEEDATREIQIKLEVQAKDLAENVEYQQRRLHRRLAANVELQERIEELQSTSRTTANQAEVEGLRKQLAEAQHDLKVQHQMQNQRICEEMEAIINENLKVKAENDAFQRQVSLLTEQLRDVKSAKEQVQQALRMQIEEQQTRIQELEYEKNRLMMYKQMDEEASKRVEIQKTTIQNYSERIKDLTHKLAEMQKTSITFFI